MKEVDKLVELPEPKRYFGHSTNCPMYTADEMRTYGRTCYEAGKQSAAGERVDLEKAKHDALWCKVASDFLPPWQWNRVNDHVRSLEREQSKIDSQKSGEGEDNG